MSNYSQINKILHRQFLNKGEILKLSIDKIKKRSLNFELSNPKHVFVCGLARAGTTALLEALDSTKVFGSLRYKYMPFILIPKMAKLYSRYFVSDNNHKIERLHADGLKINSNSAECLDEPFWINFKYKNLARKYSLEAIDKFYLEDKNIFQKNPKKNSDIFFKPVDIGDNTIPNGNAIMLINFIRLGMMDKAKKLSDSLNGYLNIYKNHMMTSLRAIDYFNNIKDGKNCNEQGCKIDA